MRFRTGALKEETDEEDEGRVNHVAVKGLGGGQRGAMIEEGGTR